MTSKTRFVATVVQSGRITSVYADAYAECTVRRMLEGQPSITKIYSILVDSETL